MISHNISKSREYSLGHSAGVQIIPFINLLDPVRRSLNLNWLELEYNTHLRRSLVDFPAVGDVHARHFDGARMVLLDLARHDGCESPRE